MRYRWGQAVALLVLSVLGIAACVFGPLYERAVEHAQLQLTLRNAPSFSRGLSVHAPSVYDSPTQLLPTGQDRRFYGPPVEGVELAVNYEVGEVSVSSLVVNRAGECAHLQIVVGHCPTRSSEVVASTSSAKALQLTLGTPLQIAVIAQGFATPPFATLHLVGLYQPFNAQNDYWFDRQYSSASGAQLQLSRGSTAYAADALFGTAGFVDYVHRQLPASAAAFPPAGDRYDDLPLLMSRVGLDDMSALRDGLARTTAAAQASSQSARVESDLGFLFGQVDTGRRQARTVVPVFATELALLVLVVLGIVVVAAADQRRAEFALARLRGLSVDGAAHLFDWQFGGLVLLSIVPGVALGWLACGFACRWWLSGSAHPELRWPVLAAAAAVTVIELLIIGLAARRAASAPVHDMLRGIPQRVSRRRVGAFETAVAAVALGGLLVVLSGDKHNVLAVLTPGLIALVVGLALSRVITGLARAGGARALWRGRLAAGLAGLQIARRPGTRRVVILLCVSAALVVSAADQWDVSARNRSVRAGAQAGAPVVLTVHAASTRALIDAVHHADPTGAYATPVIVQNPPNATPVIAVEPDSFARIASWGWARDRPAQNLLASLAPALPSPISFTGSTLELHLSDLAISRQPAPATGVTGPPGPVFLLLNLTQANGATASVRLGPLPEGSRPSTTLSASVPCAAGCRLSQLELLRATADTDTISLHAQLRGLLAGTRRALHPVPLGAAGDWATATPPTLTAAGKEQTITLHGTSGALTLAAVNAGGPAIVQHRDVPHAIPALTAGATRLSPDAQDNLTDNNIDGLSAKFNPTGTLPLVPGVHGPALLVDVHRAALAASPGLGGSTLAVWLGSDDPARERALIAALGQHGVGVVSRDTTARHLAVLAASAPAWSMQLALVTAALAVLIAAMVVIITATTSRRRRTYDASALALVGVTRATLRRAALLELLAAAFVAVLVGAVVGLIGAQLSLPGIPIFVATAPAPAVLRPTAWTTAAAAALITLAALSIASAAAALAVTRRIGPARLRESQQ